MKRLIWAMGVFFAAATAQAEPLTVEQALLIRDDAQKPGFSGRAAWIAMSYYLQGVIEGTVASARRAGPASGLCPAPEARYDLNEILAFFEEVTHQQPQQMAADAVVSHLRQRFECGG